MKKILSLVLVFVMVLSLATPAFAADVNTVGEELKTLGVLKGDANGNLMAEDKLTREQALVVLARLMNVEAEAMATTVKSSFTDVPTDSYYAPFVAYSELQKWTNGIGEGKFGYGDYATTQMVAAFMLRALGYGDTAWADTMTKAAELGLTTDVTAVEADEIVRGQVFLMMNNTLNTKPMGKDKALVYELGLKEEPVPAKFEVVSVTAINNKQVQIVFNNEVDATLAADEANYEIKDKGTTAITLGASSAQLQEDKKTVVITLDNAANDMLTNSTKAKVTVKKALKDAAGLALGADYVNSSVTVFDGVAPEVTAVKAAGLKSIELTFSEPVYDKSNADDLLATDDYLEFAGSNFEIKSGTYTYFVNSAVVSGKTLTLTTGTNLLEGDITVKYNKNAQITDYAGIAAFEGTVTLAYVKDTTAPVATVKEASQTAVTIQFDKPVNATGLKLYHSVNGVSNYGDTQSISAAKEVTFNYAVNKLPQGTVKLYLVNSTTSGQEVKDLWGNAMGNMEFTVEITIDTTAPEVASTKLNANTSFDITFSEKIDTAEAKADNFTVKKVSDGKDVSFSVTNDGNKKVTLNFTLADNTDYEIVVKSMKDTTGNKLAAEQSYVVNSGDNTHPNLAAGGVYNTSANVVYIVFDEPMNRTDMVNKALYLVDVDGDGAGNAAVALDGDDKLEVVSPTKVKLTFNDGGIVGGTTDIKLGALKDLAGKTLVNATTFQTIAAVTADTLVIEKVELTAKNKLTVTFSKELANFDNTEFDIKDADDSSALGTAVLVSSVESMTTNSDGKTVVVLVLDTDMPADNSYETNGIEFGTKTALTPANTKSVEGTVLSADIDNDAADKVAPSIKGVVFNSATQIVVSFDEALDALSVALAGKNGFSVSEGTLNSALLVGSNVVLTGTGFTANTDVTYTAGNITDNSTAKNKLATVTKAAALSVLTATAATTPNATATLALSNYTETYTANNANLLTAGGVAAAAQTIGDFTFVVTSGLAGTAEAGDQINVDVATTGVITIAITDDANAANSLNGNTVITITHVPTGAVETISVNIAGTTAVVTAP